MHDTDYNWLSRAGHRDRVAWDHVRKQVLADLRKRGRDVPLQCNDPGAEEKSEAIRAEAGLPPLIYVVEWVTSEGAPTLRKRFTRCADAVDFFNSKYYNSIWTSFRTYERR